MDVLDSGTPVVRDYRTPFFSFMVEHWPDRETVVRQADLSQARDIERALQPPVINVHVDGVPGVFTKTAGAAEAAYVPEQAQEE